MLRVPCPRCGKVPPPECGCPPLPPGPPDPPPAAAREPGATRRETIKLRRERRAGRDVIVLCDFPDDVDLAELARALKTRCAAGGTVRGRTIEIQGDHREAIVAELSRRGFTAKLAGG